MVRLSANTALLPGVPLDEVLARYAALGLEAVELIQFMHGPEVEAMEAGELQSLLGRHGLKLAALYCRPIDIWDQARLIESLNGVLRAASIAEELGAPRVVFPPLLPREGYDYEKLADACSEVLERLGPREIRICLENHHGWPMDVEGDYRAVLGRVSDPRLAIAFDTGHFTASGVDLAGFVREFAPRIAHVHLKDHIGAQSVAFGAGETDNAGALAALRQAGYDGFASIELEVEDTENLSACLADAVGYCREELKITA